MKKTFTKWLSFAAIALFAGFGVAYALPALLVEPSVSADVDELYAKIDETKTVTIQLDQAEQQIYGVSADIEIPEGFDVDVDGYTLDTDEQTVSFIKTVRKNGDIRVAIYSATPIPATVADIFTLSITPTAEEAAGTIYVKNVVVNYDVEGTATDLDVDNVAIDVYEGIAPPKNLDFEEGDAEAAGIRTYARDIAAETEETASATAVPGWTVVKAGLAEDSSTNNDKKGDGAAAGTFAYGTEAFLGGPTAGDVPCVAPATDPEGDAGQALGLLAVWTNAVQYTQDVELEAGEYALEIPVYNTVGGDAIAKNLIGVIVDGEEIFAETTKYPVGEWTTEYVLFTLEEDAAVTLSVGYTSANAGSGKMPHLFIDGVNILTGDEYEAALLATAKMAAVAALEEFPVSPDVFCYPEEVVEDALDAVDAAESVEEVGAIMAAVVASQILPYSDTTPYTIQQASSGLYLNIASAAVTLSEEPQNLNLVAAEDGYYITDGTRFVGLTSTNKWNMPTEPDLKTVIDIVATIEGQSPVWTLGEANGFVGSDETAANSKCYADKAEDATNSKWIIKRAVTETYPVEVLEEEAVIANWTRTFLGQEQNENFEVNTWSVEADASEVRTPFIQSWVWGANGAKLSAMKIAHTTIGDLVANGSYTVELTLRAYNEQAGSTTPSGLTITANEATVDLSAGQTFTYNNMAGMWDNFKLNAAATADGKLDIAINIGTAEAAPNMSWVAFKNLKVTYNSPDAPDVEKEARYVNEPTADAQDAAVDFFTYYRTPDTYKDALAAVANAKEVADFYEANAEAIASLDEVGLAVFEPVEDESTSAEELAAALKDALAAMEGGEDVTDKIVNPSFETGDLTGWTVVNGAGDTGVKPISNATYVVNNADGAYVFNTWNNGVGYEIKQTITDMPAGTYKLKALFASDANATAELYANDESVQITTPGPKETGVECELEFTLEEAGDITIGIKNPSIWYKADNFRLLYFAPDEPVDPDLVEIPQDQGKDLDTFARTDLDEGEDYNTYTADADLEVAFKMYDIDVEGCDYVVVKFAEPVPAGWNIAFWEQGGTKSVEIPAGVTEYKYVFADDPECAIVDDVLPQICVLTLWGAEKPLVMKVTGVYKHLTGGTPVAINSIDKAAAPKAGKYIENGAIVIYKNGKKYNVAGQIIK